MVEQRHVVTWMTWFGVPVCVWVVVVVGGVPVGGVLQGSMYFMGLWMGGGGTDVACEIKRKLPVLQFSAARKLP